jgi:hypothetical protein
VGRWKERWVVPRYKAMRSLKPEITDAVMGCACACAAPSKRQASKANKLALRVKKKIC